MNPSRITGQRLAAIFLLGVALLNYPLLSLFDHGVEASAIPPLILYVFLVWAGLIAVMAWIVERHDE